MFALIACTDPTRAPSGDDTGDTSEFVEQLGEVEEPPEPALDAPARASVTCAATLPTEGKTDCDVSFAWPDGTVAWAGPAGVGLHGRSSAGFPKQQFALELRDAEGADDEVALFGLAAEADWLLNGMWIDRALLRNRLGWDLFRDVGGADWAPRTAYTELELNGAYWGVYLLTERVERDAGRLAYVADDGTGARWIVKADEAGFPSTLQYGSWNLLDPAEPTTTQSEAVAAQLALVEALLTAGDAAVWNHVDLDSFVDFVLLEELVKNNDGYYLSHHLWRGDDGRIRFVPWDLDLTLGQPDYNENWRSDTWIAYRPDLIGLAAAQPVFATRMAERWTELRADAWSDEAVLERMAGYRVLLGEAAITRNFEAWPIEEVDFGGYLYVVGSYDEELARVRSWTTDRLAWIDQNVADY